jgi:hypothetical protein
MTNRNQTINYFKPVVKGTLTDFLEIIEGAIDSIGYLLLFNKSDKESKTLPKGSTTRPKTLSPTLI